MIKVKLSFIFLITFFLSNSLCSQIGIELIGNSNTFRSWNDVIYEYSSKESKILNYSYGGGINYWFRLKNHRLEFTPGVYYLYSKSTFPKSLSKFEYVSHTAGIEFDINLYPFDFNVFNFENDCPTFSDKGQWFRRNLFFQVSPGIFGSIRDIKNSSNLVGKQQIAGKVDFGFGFDLKIVRYLIVAPIIKYGFYIGEKWDGFSEIHGEESFNDLTPGNYVSLVLVFYLI